MNENDVRKANGSKTLITLIMIKDHLRDQHVQSNLLRMGAFGAHSVQRAIELLNELIFEEQKKSQ